MQQMNMKKMTFIALVFDKEHQGKHEEIDFQRWGYKRVQTVKEKMLELCEIFHFPEYYGKVCKVYATPDGYNQEKTPSITFNFPNE